MRILFWNTNRNEEINKYIANLVRDYDVDVLVTAEYVANKIELQELLEEYEQNLVENSTFGCERIDFWSNYSDVQPGVQEKYYSIQIIHKEYIICCVHLVSDLYGDCSDERFAIIQRISHDIKELEEKTGLNKVVIIGDFNEMPYDKGCLNANAFHGLPVLDMSDSPTRTVNTVEYQKYYNPMWNLLGDFSYPPGTYYLNSSKLHSPMWYILDQVIISKDVLPFFKKESLEIITSCSYDDLADKNKHPNKKISDHFPIICEIAE